MKAPIWIESLLSVYHLAISSAGCLASFGSPITMKLTTSKMKNKIPVSGTNQSLLLLSIGSSSVSAPPKRRDFAREYPSLHGRFDVRVCRHAAGADRDGAGRSRRARDDAHSRAPARLGRGRARSVADRGDRPGGDSA